MGHIERKENCNEVDVAMATLCPSGAFSWFRISSVRRKSAGTKDLGCDDEVALIHQSFEYEVAFSGFVLGFAFLSGLPADYEVPRRASPRPSVESGSVAIGGCFTAIYPRSTPGGWQLIGHTELTLWDPTADPPALLLLGSRVRFVASDS
jgi:KipI family sensor histidine kinase inhibitor